MSGGEPSLEQLSARLEELVAEVAEHDEALMSIIRRGAYEGGALPARGNATEDPQRQLELLDQAGDTYDELTAGEKRIFEALLRSSLERRQLIAFLLRLPDQQREALAFVLSLDQRQRAQLEQHVQRDERPGETED